MFRRDDSFQGPAECGEVVGSDDSRAPGVDVGEDSGGGRLGFVALRGEANDLDAPIDGVGRAFDEAELLEFGDGFSDGLFGDARSVGQVGQSGSGVVDEPEDDAVAWLYAGKAFLGQPAMQLGQRQGLHLVQ